MRISDWSSDVCSSDLPVARLGPPGPGRRVALGLALRVGDRPDVELRDLGAPAPQGVVGADRLVFHRGAGVLLPGEALVDAELGAAGRRQQDVEEAVGPAIGRASGRARGCQYG